MKRIPVTLVLHTHEDVPDDWDGGDIAFFVEENHCNDNYVMAIHREIEANPGYCQTCHRSEAFVGHIPFSEIAKLRKPDA